MLFAGFDASSSLDFCNVPNSTPACQTPPASGAALWSHFVATLFNIQVASARATERGPTPWALHTFVMADGGVKSQEGALLAMIVDEDTATGMLLTGVGHVDLRRQSNFLVVDDSELMFWVTLDACGLGCGSITALRTLHPSPLSRPGARHPAAPLPCPAETPLPAIEEAFKTFTTREDVGVLLITQTIAGTIRHMLDNYTNPVPAILEIPSKDQPYDPNQDSILTRVKGLFGDE